MTLQTPRLRPLAREMTATHDQHTAHEADADVALFRPYRRRVPTALAGVQQPEAPRTIRLKQWAADADVPYRTAATWAASGLLDGGPCAASLGFPSVQALKHGPRLWFVLLRSTAHTETANPRDAAAGDDLAALRTRIERLEQWAASVAAFGSTGAAD